MEVEEPPTLPLAPPAPPPPRSVAELLAALQEQQPAGERDLVNVLLVALADRFTDSGVQFGPNESEVHKQAISEMREADGVMILVGLLEPEPVEHQDPLLLNVCRVLFAMAALSEGKQLAVRAGRCCAALPPPPRTAAT